MRKKKLKYEIIEKSEEEFLIKKGVQYYGSFTKRYLAVINKRLFEKRDRDGGK